MCGIAGCIENSDAMRSVVQALSKLQNRGYDSAGVCSVSHHKLEMCKAVSLPNKNAIQAIVNNPLTESNSQNTIGHTRWATHGPKTVENAHPHHDDNKRFAMVHNGIIENYVQLKNELVNVGFSFYGQTDTEIVCKYMTHLHQHGHALTELNRFLMGSWAILVVDKEDPNKIYFMKNGSPLLLGYNKKFTKAMFVSELIGFDEEIDYYYVLADNDFGYIHNENNRITIHTKNNYKANELLDAVTHLTPDPYPYWTIKEIHDQVNAITCLLSERLIFSNNQYQIRMPELDQRKNQLAKTDHIIFLACGTSYHAAQIGMKFLKEFRSNFTMEVIDGADFEETDLPPNKNTILVLLSQSGETKDLYRALVIGKEHRMSSIGLINVEGSLIAREVDCCLYLKAGREHAVASTKSFTNQVVMLLLFSLWMTPNLDSYVRNTYLKALSELSVDFYKMIQKSNNEIPEILSYFDDQNNCFILGKHSNEWIAKEGSLKIKEISYIHSEGFSAAALKHGPFALLTDNIPIVLLANNDRFFSKIENVAAEVKSRCANVIFITNKKIEKNNIDHLFYYETESVLFPLITIVPLQVLAYHLSLKRGNHPDYPRNLAKVVTVE